MTSRDHIIQCLLSRMRHPSYLEIGVNRGHCFFNVRARKKIAVDPQFNFPFYRRLHPLEIFRSHYYPVTSNEFFEKHARQHPGGFDLIYVDGLHTHEQTLLDVENSLKFLKPEGRIVLHDCNPPNAGAAVPATSYKEAKNKKHPAWTREWCGDVWKTIVSLRSTRMDLDIVVFDCDYGVGVIRRCPQDSLPIKDEIDLASIGYDDLVKHRKEWLNLVPENEIEKTLKGLA